MAYDPYRGMTPGGQFVGMLGTSLSQILGGYLGAKLEQDRMQRDFDSNKRILKARYPNMPEDQINEYSQVSSRDLPQLIQGLGASQFQQVMRGQAPGIAESQQLPEEMLPEQEFAPGMQQAGMQVPDMQDMGLGGQIPQQQPIAPQPIMSPEEERLENSSTITNELNRLNAIEESLKASNLDMQQYMGIRKYLDDSKQALKDAMLSDQELQMKIAEAERKRILDEQKTAFERQKFERKILTEDRDYKLKQLQREEKQQDRLFEEYGERYSNLQNTEKDYLEDLATLNAMKLSNNDPNINFGSSTFNSFVDFLTNKIGIPAGGLRGDAAQILEKQNADLLQRIPTKLKGTGIRSQQAFKAIAKKYPGVHQSYRARAMVIESNILQAKLHLKHIEIARKLKEANNNRFIPGFMEKVEEKMVPYYKKYFKDIAEIPKKIEKNKNLQIKQRAYERGRIGGVLGGLSGAALGAIKGVTLGGVPGAIAGGLTGLTGGIAGALGGETVLGSDAAGYIASQVEEAPRVLKEGANRLGRSMNLTDILSLQNPMAFRR